MLSWDFLIDFNNNINKEFLMYVKEESSTEVLWDQVLLNCVKTSLIGDCAIRLILRNGNFEQKLHE